MTAPTSLEQRLAEHDLDLMGYVPAQLKEQDKLSLLALHASLRRVTGGSFAYLEIGSYLGGSLQAVIADPACRLAISIDLRPGTAADKRGRRSDYRGVTADTMRENLSRVPGADLAKLVCIDAAVLGVDPAGVERPDLCFIDGEHTDEAVLSDARFCRLALRGRGCIVFHDAHIVFWGIKRFLVELEADEAEFTAYVLPASLFVVELGPLRLRDEPEVRARFERAWDGYFHALGDNDRYRLIVNGRAVRLLRRLRLIRGA